jgi:SAM-dependent methyltransferase
VTDPDPDEASRRLAAESLAADDATGWFERLYSDAERGAAVVPWDRGGPQPLLMHWAQGRSVENGSALVVGAGLGSDAEFVASLGWPTVAFDVSATAVRSAQARYPDSPVQYVAANLLDPPQQWHAAFALVVECLTVQSLPEALRESAIANISGFVAPGGTLVVVANARAETEPADGPPWPLTRTQIESFAAHGLQTVRLDLLPNPLNPTALRWLAEFRR